MNGPKRATLKSIRPGPPPKFIPTTASGEAWSKNHFISIHNISSAPTLLILLRQYKSVLSIRELKIPGPLEHGHLSFDLASAAELAFDL